MLKLIIILNIIGNVTFIEVLHCQTMTVAVLLVAHASETKGKREKDGERRETSEFMVYLVSCYSLMRRRHNCCPLDIYSHIETSCPVNNIIHFPSRLPTLIQGTNCSSSEKERTLHPRTLYRRKKKR